MCAFETFPAIVTPRLRLRGPRMDDAARLAGFAEIACAAEGLPSPPQADVRAHAEAFLGKVTQLDRKADALFAIEDGDAGLVGMIGFHEDRPRRPEVGYWVARPFRGRGYAAEAVEAALVWAHESWGRRAVWAGHAPGDEAAARTLVNAGFLYTGDLDLRPSPTRMMVWLA